MAEEEHLQLIPVPLPTEIPAPPSLENLPIDILHSATVEMLINQNDDLAARLKVNIRRNSVQEQEILNLQRHLDELKKSSDNLKSQNELIKEKEGIWQKQRQSKERQLKTNEEEIHLLELRYNELYTTTQHKKKELYREIIEQNQSVNDLQKKITARKLVSERGKDKVREILFSAAGALDVQKLSAKKIAAQNDLYKKRLQEAKEAAQKKDQLFKEKMSEISRISKIHNQNLKTDIQHLQKKLQAQDDKQKENTFTFDDRERELEKKLEALKEQLALELKNREQIARLSEEIVVIKNKKIATERTTQAHTDNLQVENTRLLEQKNRYKEEAQSLSVQFAENEVLLETCEKRLITVTRDNQDMEKQLDSLKSLWMDLQHKFEKERLKSESLNKINKQISQKFSKDRQEKAIDRSLCEQEVKSIQADDTKFNERLSEIYSSQFGPIDGKKNLDM